MATAITWNNTAYSVPAAGEINWQALSAFLVDLGNNAQTTNFQKFNARSATTTPVTMDSNTDAAIIVNLAAPGASAVNLAAGTAGRVILVADGLGDAATNNITITPNGAETINGAANLVLNRNREAVLLVFQGTNWSVVSSYIVPGQISHTELQDIGTNTHAQIDSHIASTANPHDVGGTQLSNAVPITLGGTGQITATAGFDALSPLTTKGDVLSRDGANNARLAVGADGTVLTADSAEATGLKWAPSLANPMDDLGQLIKGGAAGAAAKFDHGAAYTVLQTNAGATDLAYSLVTNNNVDGAAAIAGTKISPDFGAQNVVTTGNAGFGTATPNLGSHSKAVTIQSVTAANRVALELNGNSTNANGAVEYYNNGVLAAGIYNVNSGASGRLYFEQNSIETITIKNGQIGIRNNNPAQDLDIIGTGGAKIRQGENATRYTEAMGASDGAGSEASYIISCTNSAGTLTERMRVTGAGNAIVQNGNLSVLTTGSSSGTSVIEAIPGGGTAFQVRQNGNIYCQGTYGATTAGGIAMLVNSSGLTGTTTSTEKSKINIVPIDDVSIVYNTKVVNFNYRKIDDKGNYTDEAESFVEAGAIAEQVEKLDPSFCFYQDEHLRGIRYDRYIPYLLKAMQDMQEKIENLENKLAG